MLTDTTPSSSRSAASGGGRRRRALALAAGTTALLAAIVASGAFFGSTAQAAPSSTATTSHTATTSKAAQPVQSPAQSAVASPSPTGAVAPTIDVSDSDTARVQLSGSGTPGAAFRVLDPAHPASSLCSGTVSDSGSWSCTVTLSSGADQTVTIRDLTDTQFADVPSQPFSVLAAPTIATSGVAVGATVTGTGFAGATVTLTFASKSTGATSTVQTTVDGSGAWRAVLPASSVPTGSYSASATQSSSQIPAVPISSTSASAAITVDRVSPPVPVISTPAAGSTVTAQPFVMAGTGETGDTVTTYIDSNPVCVAKVLAGHWNCSTTGLMIPVGTRTLQAAQLDPAGNYGPASAARSIVFASAATTTPAAPPTSSSPSTTPSQSTSPSSVPSPSATATPSAPATGGGGTGTGSGTGSSGSSGTGSGSSGGGTAVGSGSGLQAFNAEADAASWTGSTGFGRNLPTLAQTLSGWSWPVALVLGLIFALFVIAPLRLAVATFGGRIAFHARRLTGRNRPRGEVDDTPFLSPMTAVALTIAGGAILMALSIGVDNQLRYVRLLVAIVIGLLAINGLGVLLPTWILSRRLGLAVRLRVSPRMLAVAAVAALVTRVFSLDPPMVLGVLVSAAVVDSVSRDTAVLPTREADVRRRGILAAVQLGSLTLLAFAAWVVHGLVPISTTDFVVEIGRETLATICLAGLGSLIVLLIPVGGLPGRALYDWSRPTLVGLAIVGVAAAGVVFAGDPNEAFPIMPFVIVALVFAVVTMGAWAWVRYVEPEVDELA